MFSGILIRQTQILNSKMNAEPQDLIKEGYHQIEQLGHKELIPFVKTNLKKKTRATSLYNVALGTTFAVLIGFLSYYFFADHLSFSQAFAYAGIGIFSTLFLIPIHEFIHGLAYKWVGAKNTSYDVNWKKFYFMALADKFVCNRKEFHIVALAPFITISILLILASLLLPGYFIFIPLGALLFHTMCCGGDFGLLSFFDSNKNVELVTYDDVEENISYFLAKSA